jgi:hypothetical protein
MSASTLLVPSARAAFAALIDYAGLFPPAELSLAQSQREYRAARSGEHAWILGRFIIPAAALAQLPQPFEGSLCVIVDAEVDALHRVAALRRTDANVEAIEIPLQSTISPFRETLSRDEILNLLGALDADLVTSGLRGLPTFLEIPRTRPWSTVMPETMDAIARFGFGAKIRCGGVTANAFPSVDEIAAFITCARASGVPFKATAGLHHPVRRVDAASGFHMHGFLNILVGAALAGKVDRSTLVRVVAEEDPRAFVFDDDALAWRDQRIPSGELARIRNSAFVSYGSCSFAEPIEDLIALGMLPAK